MARQPFSSYYLDQYAGDLNPSDKVDFFPGDPEQYMNRLIEIQAPRDRLIAFYKTLFNFADPPTYETKLVQHITLVGTVASGLVGGLLKTPDIHMEYQMKHNASVFESRYRGNRHFWDTLVTGVGAKGLRYSIRAFAFCALATIIPTSSTIYRNKPYLLDHMLGFTAFGALSRLWLGPRAVLTGGLIGSVVGCVLYGSLKALELTTGMSMAQMRYVEHILNKQKLELELRKKMELKEKDHMDHLEEIPRSPF